MSNSDKTDESTRKALSERRQTTDPSAKSVISIVQRGNLKTLEETLRRQWRMGQNIVLCWSSDERGLLVVFVPHYFLGNYCAADDRPASVVQDNETFISELISGQRRKTRDQLFQVSKRLDVAPTFVKLDSALSEDVAVIAAVEQVIKRYGLSYTERRAVLLFDIVDFSVHTPFEQASQLNSLSYSLNSTCKKLLDQGIAIDFARTTTGDGYYIWNRDPGANANRDLFVFMLLAVADNAVAQASSKGKTVPVIRTGYHIGGHYELYLAEGMNPSAISYIVGDVTIKLARMLDLAQPNQVLVGEFPQQQEPHSAAEDNALAAASTIPFVNICDQELSMLHGVSISGADINAISCGLTTGAGQAGGDRPRRFRIVDKHGLSHFVYNLQIKIDLGGSKLSLGLEGDQLPGRAGDASKEQTNQKPADAAPSAEELLDDLATILGKGADKVSGDD